MPIKISMTILGDKQLNRAFSRFGDSVDDLRPAWKKVSEKLFKISAKQFDTQGGSGASGGWTPLSDNYLLWKQAQVGNQPILVFSGDMRRSLTQKGGQNILEMKRDHMKWGTRVGYATVHQKPQSSPIPQRKIIDLNEQDKRDLMREIQRHLVDVAKKNGLL